jgi:uncharacterized protein (TIGR03083 family)
VVVDTHDHLRALDAEGKLLAQAAHRAGLNAHIPTCPGWQIAHLLRHVGYVHRWAAAHVVQASLTPLEALSEREILEQGPVDEELLLWFVDGHTALVQALRSADDDVACWTFLDAPSPLAFWSRRQAHETALHRVDAEAASGSVTPFEPALAADGIDELIIGFAPRERMTGPQTDRYVLAVRSLDTGEEWSITFGEKRLRTCRGSGPADSTLEGTASDLYVVLWNRDTSNAPVVLQGDPHGLERWRAGIHVGWR